MSDLKPLIIYGEIFAPNPFKVMLVLRALGLPYTVINVPISEVKGAEYIKVCVNGRLPTLVDPNNVVNGGGEGEGFTIWESGAIIEYLVERYDNTEHKISFSAGTNEYYLAKQWLHFQMSGQGPYYGQGGWFQNYHAERLPSAIERYQKEIRRVSGVLDKALSQSQWLVGNKLSYADLAFIPWQMVVPFIIKEGWRPEEEFPHLHAWMQRMNTQSVAGEVSREREEWIAKNGLPKP